MRARFLALIGWMREELREIARSAQRARELCEKALRTGDDGYWDGVALNLHRFYTGAERIFEEIAREIDGHRPGGPDWHRDLLVQMSAEIPGIRPPVLFRETRECLDEYRGFRHLVRHIYAFRLKPERLQELAESVEPCLKRLRQDLERFADFLHRMAGSEAEASTGEGPAREDPESTS
ncbi:ribonuclease toxin HepT-like protein [Thermoflexus hugenholtzii]